MDGRTHRRTHRPPRGNHNTPPLLCARGIKMAELLANSRDPDKMLHSEASDLGLHWLPVILLWGLQSKKG